MKFRSIVTALMLISLPCTLIEAFPNINQRLILENARHLDPQALKYAVNGLRWAMQHGKVNRSDILTVIDFNQPSAAKRLWVINLSTSRVLLNTYTTQGKQSGVFYATRFSNRARSNETSLGVYKTMNAYGGGHGLSLRLQGLERGINDNAYERAIVAHPAWYATEDYVRANHRTGRSWGCFGLDPSLSRKFVELTKNGSIIFAYASPERHDPNLSNFG